MPGFILKQFKFDVSIYAFVAILEHETTKKLEIIGLYFNDLTDNYALYHDFSNEKEKIQIDEDDQLIKYVEDICQYQQN